MSGPDDVTVDANDVVKLIRERDAAVAAKNNAYAERNKVVVALAWLARHLGIPVCVYDDKDAEAGWTTVLLIQFPFGQCTWHFSDEEFASMLLGFPTYNSLCKPYDGHTTAEKYDRLASVSHWDGKR